MAEFLVKLADDRGRVMEQQERGASEAEVRERFLQQGYLVYWVKPQGLLSGGSISLRRNRVTLDQFVIFNQQFLTLIRAGLPILTALELLAKRQRNLYFRNILGNVRERVKAGELLSEAFEAQGVFPRIYTTTLLAGEKSGNLEEVLSRFISFQRITMSFRKRLLASLIYPTVLVIAMVSLVTFMITYVVPKFADLYAALNRELPPLTTFILGLGVATQRYAFIILPVLAIAIALLWRWSRTEAGGRTAESARLKLPLVGDIWLKYQVAMFSRMLSTLLAGGLPLVSALQTTAGSMSSRLLRSAIHHAEQLVREGRPLAGSLEVSNVFPELAVEMVEVGESTGALPTMLNSVAEFYEEDVQNALTAAMSLIEPVVLLLMGLVVALVLFALYMPIFSLGSGGGIR